MSNTVIEQYHEKMCLRPLMGQKFRPQNLHQQNLKNKNVSPKLYHIMNFKTRGQNSLDPEKSPNLNLHCLQIQ